MGASSRGHHWWGHQFAWPIITAIAGTVMVRTRNVSSKIPMPITKPTWTIVLMPANIRPNIEAAKMTPAEVITPPVERTVRITLKRTPYLDSSRIREMRSKL